MSKRKYPSELNTRTVRVNIGDWQMLLALARQHDTTVAKILHLAIAGQARQSQVTVTPKTQIPMPFTTAYRAIPVTAYRAIPVTTIATNGSKPAAVGIKPKGARYD